MAGWCAGGVVLLGALDKRAARPGRPADGWFGRGPHAVSVCSARVGREAEQRVHGRHPRAVQEPEGGQAKVCVEEVGPVAGVGREATLAVLARQQKGPCRARVEKRALPEECERGRDPPRVARVRLLFGPPVEAPTA